MIISLIIVAAIILIDQISKLCLYGMSCSLIGDFLWLESPELNQGASFSMFQGGTVFFIILSIPVVAFMFWLICSKKYKQTRFFKICLAIILGGAIGNLIDRIFLGGVRDFIYFKSINFAIFNIADTAITIGTIMLVIYLLIVTFKPQNKETEVKENIAITTSEVQTNNLKPEEDLEKINALKDIREDLKKQTQKKEIENKSVEELPKKSTPKKSAAKPQKKVKQEKP